MESYSFHLQLYKASIGNIFTLPNLPVAVTWICEPPSLPCVRNNRKSIILFGFPIYLWLPLVWEKYVQKYEEFSLYVYRYALTLPSWTLDQIEHMIYLPFYIFILKYSFLPLATFNKLYGFFFLWKREALFVHHFFILWVIQVAVLKNKSVIIFFVSQKH